MVYKGIYVYTRPTRHDDWCDAITNYMHDGVRPYYYLHTFGASNSHQPVEPKCPRVQYIQFVAENAYENNERNTRDGQSGPVVH